MATVILDNLAGGLSESDILKSCPTLQSDDIRVVIAYASDSAEARVG